MAVAINLTGADEYFRAANHVQAPVWAQFDNDLKLAGIAHATRRISRELGSEVTAETVDDSLFYHPDWAVYEQALFMLTTSQAIPNGEQTAAHFLSTDVSAGDGVRAAPKDTDMLAPEAAQYLRRPRRSIYMVRG